MENTTILKEYKALKKWHISHLRQEWTRINRIGCPKELDKEGLISDLLRDSYGNKKVNLAFNLAI